DLPSPRIHPRVRRCATRSATGYAAVTHPLPVPPPQAGEGSIGFRHAGRSERSSARGRRDWASPDFADTLQEVDNAEIGGQEMSTKRRKFTDEYKAEAVRIWRESGKSVRRVAVELGLTPSALERWVKQEKDAQQLGRTRASVKAEREELLRLRRENELLRQERDFLRSAAAYFAKERK